MTGVRPRIIDFEAWVSRRGAFEHKWHTLLLAVAVLVLAACTASNEPNGPHSGVSNDSDSEARPEAIGSPSLPTNGLAELRESIYGTVDESYLALHLRHEEILQSCMGEEGFEYVPLPYATFESPRFDPSIDPGEFAQVYGYGRSTLFEAEEAASALIAATYIDPNDALKAEMSDATLADYSEAMYGPPSEEEGPVSETGGYVPADPRSGCAGEATGVYGGVYNPEISDDARQALLDVERSVAAEPDVQIAAHAWEACMRSAGYAVSTRQDAIALTDQLFAPLLATNATRPTTAIDPNGEPVSVMIPDLDQTKLAEAQRIEIEVAVADYRCDLDAGLSAVVETTRIRVQERLISQWYGELEGS